MVDRLAGITNDRAVGMSSTTGVDMSVRIGFGVALTVKANSVKGLTYIGIGAGFGASANMTAADVEARNGDGGTGLAVDISGSLSNGIGGINSGMTVGTHGSTFSIKPGIGVTTGVSLNGTIGWKF
jgi:hypothetical protein